LRSLDSWLVYQQQIHPQSIDLGLVRLREVLSRLHWRAPDVPVITVAGTNGKGSVVEYCTSMLRAAGLRVGTFTSPHLRDYRERIRIGGRCIDEVSLLRVFERIESARGDTSLTFFEYNTLAALLCFAATDLDVWVLEVGLGGRLDAVNVVDPDVAVVVSIGLDHQEFLGHDLARIGAEKAGIFRAQRAAVIGSTQVPPSVYERAVAVGAKLKRPALEYRYARRDTAWRYHGPRWVLDELPPPALAGDTQFENAATAIAALEELDHRLRIDAAAVARGLTQTRMQGRFEVIRSSDPGTATWILDVAHNPAAARVLAQNLRARPIAGRTFAVCGMLADKDAAAVARELRLQFDCWWLAGIAGVRGESGAVLRTRIRGVVDAQLIAADDIAAACCAAAERATASDRIVVFGSFHAVAPALDWLELRGIVPRADESRI
jgi:dihydrofolate synthase / folylpolyglutamate synthase